MKKHIKMRNIVPDIIVYRILIYEILIRDIEDRAVAPKLHKADRLILVWSFFISLFRNLYSFTLSYIILLY